MNIYLYKQLKMNVLQFISIIIEFASSEIT